MSLNKSPTRKTYPHKFFQLVSQKKKKKCLDWHWPLKISNKLHTTSLQNLESDGCLGKTDQACIPIWTFRQRTGKRGSINSKNSKSMHVKKQQKVICMHSTQWSENTWADKRPAPDNSQQLSTLQLLLAPSSIFSYTISVPGAQAIITIALYKLWRLPSTCLILTTNIFHYIYLYIWKSVTFSTLGTMDTITCQCLLFS